MKFCASSFWSQGWCACAEQNMNLECCTKATLQEDIAVKVYLITTFEICLRAVKESFQQMIDIRGHFRKLKTIFL